LVQFGSDPAPHTRQVKLIILDRDGVINRPNVMVGVELAGLPETIRPLGLAEPEVASC